MAREITTQTQTFNGVSAELIFNIPAGHTIVFFEMENVTQSGGAFGVACRVGNSGVFRSDADHQRQRFTATTIGSHSSAEDVFWAIDSSQASQDANGVFYNMRTAAPVIMRAQQGDTGSEIRNLMMAPSTTAYSQIRFFGWTGAVEKVPTGGTIRVTSWKRRNKVFSRAMTGNAVEDFTGLGQYDCLVVVSPNLNLSAATGQMRMRVSADNGVSFDAGASDYLNHVTTTQSAGSSFKLAEQDQLVQSFASVFMNFNTPIPTVQVWHSQWLASILRIVTGSRDGSQAESAIRLLTDGAETLDTGTVYVVGYKL